MTHEEMALNLQLTLDEYIAQCEVVGLKPGKIKSISINTRYTRTAGMCKEHKIGKLVTYSIEVAFFTMKQSQEFINDTVMHEILHTIPGCFNHGPNWQAAATKINEAYGYKLSTTYNDANLEEKMDKEKPYEIRCTACDIKTFRKTASGPVKEPERYECTNCGGNGTFEVKYNGELLIYKKKKENKPKYTILCKGCGLMVNKKRASDLTKNISNYNCSNCKGALTLIINH